MKAAMPPISKIPETNTAMPFSELFGSEAMVGKRAGRP